MTDEIVNLRSFVPRDRTRDRTLRMSDKAMKEIESHFDNDREAFRLLDLINAEFQNDPMSVQCFDLGVVQRVKACVEKRKELAKSNPVWID